MVGWSQYSLKRLFHLSLCQCVSPTDSPHEFCCKILLSAPSICYGYIVKVAKSGQKMRNWIFELYAVFQLDKKYTQYVTYIDRLIRVNTVKASCPKIE